MNTRLICREIKEKRCHRRGAITFLAVVFLIVSIAFLALSIDLGYMAVTEVELQNAADSGALAGARALCNGREEAIAATQLWASKNSAAKRNVEIVAAQDIEIGVWDESAATFTVLPSGSSQSPNAIKLTCRRVASRGNPLNLFIAPAIGTRSADLSATSIARIQTSRCGLITGLQSVTMSGSSYTNSYSSSNGFYSSATATNQGNVCSNGVITMSGSAAIRGDAHPGIGKTVKSSSSIGVLGDTSPLTKALSYPAVDPGDAATINNNSKIPNSVQNKVPLNSKGEFTLSGGDSVNLPPGTYYFSKLSLSGGSTINISGDTEIYVTGDVAISGGSLANTTFLPQNLQLFLLGTKCAISGGSDFYGVIYGPSALVDRSSDADFYGAIIAGQLVMSGSGGIHADQSLDSQMLGGGVPRSKLVQ